MFALRDMFQQACFGAAVVQRVEIVPARGSCYVDWLVEATSVGRAQFSTKIRMIVHDGTSHLLLEEMSDLQKPLYVSPPGKLLFDVLIHRHAVLF